MKKIHLILTSLLLLNSIANYAQKRDKDEYLFTPDILNSYCKASDLEEIYTGKNINYLKSTNQNTWVVYSDRRNNKLYYNPNGRTKTEELDFMEPLTIKEVQGDWLRVYSPFYKKGNTIEKHKERGWINVSNLIISSYTQLNEKGTPKKGMTLISFDGPEEASQLNEIQKYNFYNGPDLRSFKQESKKFTIYYILKENKGTRLLSKADKLNTKNGIGTQDELVMKVGGWMSNLHITPWDHRVCLEVASNESAISEYTNIDSIPVYQTDEELESFIRTKKIINSIRTFTCSRKRPNPYEMRMPILANKNDKIKQVATVGTSNENSSIITNKAEIEQKIKNANNKLDNVNILFVIDGTKSMAPYYKAIAKSVSEIIDNNKLSRGNNLRFGLVIYRDYIDGLQSCVVEPLNGNHKLITNKLLNTPCTNNPLDLDLEEAQYNGLTEGIKRAGFNKDQSNIIVLIGDAGNHQPDPQGQNKEQVIKLMREFEVSLITFQVYYGGEPTFSYFNADAKYYLKEAGKLFSENSNVDVILNPISNIKNTYKLIYNDRITNKPIDFYMFGRFTFASNTLPMPTAILEQNIIGSVFEYFEWVTNFKNETEKIISNPIVGKYNPIVLERICKKYKLSEKQCKVLFEKVEEFSFIGYTSSRFYEKQVDCFVPVVFLSATELDRISNTFDDLKNQNISKSDKKNAFKDALIEQTIKILGGADPDIILKMDLNEIWDIILAIPFDKFKKYGNLATTKLRDMDKLDNKTFNEFMINFEASINKFSANRFRDYSFELADQTFYWIPLNSIPGNE